LVSWLAVGCSTVTKKEVKPLYFPAAPDPPRVVSVYRFFTNRDLEEHSAFNEFVVGKAPTIRFDHPYGVAYHDHTIYVADPQLGAILLFDLEKRKVAWIYSEGAGQMKRPNGVAVADDGTVYIADAGRDQVLRYNAEHKYIGAWGVKGKFHPTGVAVHGDRLYVADVLGHYIRVFDRKTGKLLQSIGGQAGREGKKVPLGYLVAPTNVAVGPEGNIYASDTMQSVVVKYDPEGHALSHVGARGDAPGSFARPRGVAVDSEGHIYVVDAAFENVQMFNPKGQALMFFGGAGSIPGRLWLPSGICVGVPVDDFFKPYIPKDFVAESLMLVANQYGPANISVFAFGHGKDNNNKKKPTEAPAAKAGDQGKEKGKEKGAAAAGTTGANAEKTGAVTGTKQDQAEPAKAVVPGGKDNGSAPPQPADGQPAKEAAPGGAQP